MPSAYKEGQNTQRNTLKLDEHDFTENTRE